LRALFGQTSRSSIGMMGFLRELRERNVDRAALAYAGAGWLIAQGGQLLADAYQWPGWVIRALLAALMLGFPLVLVLAWFFELTPAGLVSGKPDAPASAVRLRTRRKLDIAIAALVVAALGYLAATYDWRKSSPGPKTAAPVATATLAVLPFKPLLAATRDEALELGMTDTLIARLSSIEEVTVRPLSSVRRYGGLEQDAIHAGRELEVESVLDGSIQRMGDRLRVTVRLLRVADGRQLWSDQFDERLDDVFAVQDSIAGRVISALALRLTDSDRARMERYRSSDAEAYHLYVLGRGLCVTRRVENVDRAIGYLEQAVSRDPGYALLHAALADCYTVKAVFGVEPPRPLFARAREAVLRALSLDPELSSAHASLGHVKMQYEFDWAGAEQEFLRAIALNADNAEPHYRLALLRGFSGHLDEALAEMAIARRLEPLWAPAAANHAWLLVLAGRYTEAESEARRAIEIDPDFPHSRSVLGRALLGQGRYDEALEAFESRKGLGPRSYADVAVALAAAGRIDQARQERDRILALSRQRYVPAYDIAVIHASLGDDETALAWLDKAVEERSTLAQVGVDPALASMRANPGFKAILRRIGAPDAT
jgi:TolB-like protein/Tfp pilus assembly protein PilF